MNYIISNVKCSPDKVKSFLWRRGEAGDSLIFLNTAVNYEIFKDVPCNKRVLICSVSGFKDGGQWECQQKDECNIVQNKYYNTRKEWYGHERELFDDFELVIDLDLKHGTHFYPQFQYPFGKWGTTGFMVYSYLKYLQNPVTLVNFFPASDHTTPHWGGHDWAYEQSVYDRDNPTIIDLR